MNQVWIKRIIVLLCVQIIVFSQGCSKVTENDLFSDELAMDEPYRNIVSSSIFHNGYLYYCDQREDGNYIVRRINLETGLISSPCQDPLCPHDTEECPFCLTSFVSPIIRCFGQNILLQYVYRQQSGSVSEGTYSNQVMVYCLYSLEDGEWKHIFTANQTATKLSQRVVQLGDCLYHVTFGNPKSSGGETYTPTDLQCYNMKTGKETVIYSHDYYLNLVAAGKERLYVYEDVADETRFYSMRGDGSDFRAEPTMKNLSAYIYQNKIYAALVENNTDDMAIYMNDLETGEFRVIVEEHLPGTMCIADSKLYYLTKDGLAQYNRDLAALKEEAGSISVMNRNEPYKTKLAALKQEYHAASARLWCAELDGSNPVCIAELPGAGILFMYLMDGYMYTQYEFYNTETGERLGSPEQQGAPCRIEITTGKIEFLSEIGK